MQTQLSEAQLTFSSFFPAHPAPTATAQQAGEERASAAQQEVMEEIEKKQERILELRKEIGDAEDHIAMVEEEELDLEVDEGDEDIFYAGAPALEEDLTEMRYENEEEIRSIGEEIGFLEEKLR